MSIKKVARLMIAGVSSNTGKTSVVCGVLGALKKRMSVSAFKCGPDFIDPMFHREVVKVPSRNLDIFLMGEKGVNATLSKNASDINVIEGVMGYYDGIGTTYEASSYSVAKHTKTPVILVVSPKGISTSLAAQINGYRSFAPDSNIQGVIINNIPERMYDHYKTIIEQHCDIKVYGFLPHMPEVVLHSRNLGLVTAKEVEHLESIIEKLTESADANLDIDGLISLANSAEDIESAELIENVTDKVCKIAVARDKAFCFYYQDNIELLEQLGAEIVYFSPLDDEKLPSDIHAIVFGGGYPELNLAQLSNNKNLIADIKQKHAQNMPILAECGGFMYLNTAMTQDGVRYELANLVAGEIEMAGRLQNFGYFKMVAEVDNALCKTGENINMHEFHYSKSTAKVGAYKAIKASNAREHETMYVDGNLVAGYPHVHFYGNIEFARTFIKKACEYKGLK